MKERGVNGKRGNCSDRLVACGGWLVLMMFRLVLSGSLEKDDFKRGENENKGEE